MHSVFSFSSNCGNNTLGSTPVETELLFTSYLLVTGLAMLVTSWVSSRIGTKATLMTGLGLIVLFSLLSALSGSVDAIIGFRAGWGLGNALFISTALATIVGAAAGGSGAAIVLYEAALGLGIAIGPLLGGLLGEVSWRGPFFGVLSAFTPLEVEPCARVVRSTTVLIF